MPYVHWQYFLAIESDLEATSRFVEFSKKNYATYSIEFARILLSCGSEVDVVAKALCQKIVPNGEYGNIGDYKTTIINTYKKFSTFEVSFPRYGFSIKPFEEWPGQKLSWWDAYTDVKHHRDIYFEKANLENALLSVGGLFALVLYYYKDDLSKPDFRWPSFPKLMVIPGAPDLLDYGEWQLPDS
jgi:hypothetical protein